MQLHDLHVKPGLATGLQKLADLAAWHDEHSSSESMPLPQVGAGQSFPVRNRSASVVPG